MGDQILLQYGHKICIFKLRLLDCFQYAMESGPSCSYQADSDVAEGRAF